MLLKKVSVTEVDVVGALSCGVMDAFVLEGCRSLMEEGYFWSGLLLSFVLGQHRGDFNFKGLLRNTKHAHSEISGDIYSDENLARYQREMKDNPSQFLDFLRHQFILKFNRALTGPELNAFNTRLAPLLLQSMLSNDNGYVPEGCGWAIETVMGTSEASLSAFITSNEALLVRGLFEESHTMKKLLDYCLVSKDLKHTYLKAIQKMGPMHRTNNLVSFYSTVTILADTEDKTLFFRVFKDVIRQDILGINPSKISQKNLNGFATILGMLRPAIGALSVDEYDSLQVLCDDVQKKMATFPRGKKAVDTTALDNALKELQKYVASSEAKTAVRHTKQQEKLVARQKKYRPMMDNVLRSLGDGTIFRIEDSKELGKGQIQINPDFDIDRGVTLGGQMYFIQAMPREDRLKLDHDIRSLAGDVSFTEGQVTALETKLNAFTNRLKPYSQQALKETLKAALHSAYMPLESKYEGLIAFSDSIPETRKGDKKWVLEGASSVQRQESLVLECQSRLKVQCNILLGLDTEDELVSLDHALQRYADTMEASELWLDHYMVLDQSYRDFLSHLQALSNSIHDLELAQPDIQNRIDLQDMALEWDDAKSCVTSGTMSSVGVAKNFFMGDIRSGLAMFHDYTRECRNDALAEIDPEHNDIRVIAEALFGAQWLAIFCHPLNTMASFSFEGGQIQTLQHKFSTSRHLSDDNRTSTITEELVKKLDVLIGELNWGLKSLGKQDLISKDEDFLKYIAKEYLEKLGTKVESGSSHFAFKFPYLLPDVRHDDHLNTDHVRQAYFRLSYLHYRYLLHTKK